MEGWEPLRRLLSDDWGRGVACRMESIAPSVDITENDDAYLIRGEIPGVDRDDVTVDVRDGVLELSLAKTPEVRPKQIVVRT